MTRRPGWWLAAVVGLLFGVGCTPTTDLSEHPRRVVARSRVAVTQGSAVAITQDERIAVVTNRTDGVVSIVHLDPDKDLTDLVLAENRTELPFHPLNRSQPWVAVIAPNDDTAYVLLRGRAEVVRIDGLHGVPRVFEEPVAVGSEPTAMVISPTGAFLYVANSGEGTISSIVTEELVEGKWDLNHRLASSGWLGNLIAREDQTGGVWKLAELQRSRRPALAHPRALALTDDGDEDDLDETLYATEFFSQPDLAAGLDDPDVSRQGVVYPIVVGVGAGNPPEGAPSLIPLGSVRDTGFKDSEGNDTGCFPNQLYGAVAREDRLYITSMCASPKGPIEPGPAMPPDLTANNFKTIVHPSIFVVDTRTNSEIPAERIILTQELAGLYAADEPDVRMPLIPSEIVAARSADGVTRTYVSAFGASAVFPVTFAAGSAQIGAGERRFISLGPSATPSGMALLSKQGALVLDDSTPALKVVDLSESRVVRSTATLLQNWREASGLDPSELVNEDARAGRRLFATGLGAWSFKGQAWSSCESCHPDGLTDGVTWRFVRGPRRTISLAGTYYRDDPVQRIPLWTANVDEVHDVEAITRRVSGGMGGIVWQPYTNQAHLDCRLIYDGTVPTLQTPVSQECPAPMRTSDRHNGLNGALSTLPVAMGDQCVAEAVAYVEPQTCDINGAHDWELIDAFIRSVRAPRAPTNLEPDLVSEGAALFRDYRCHACHGGPGFTVSRVFYVPGAEPNGQIPAKPPATADAATQARLLGTLRTKTYQVPTNAPAAFGVGGSILPFRTGLEPNPARTELELVQFVYGTSMPPPPPDELRCALRKVGTFPDEGDIGVVAEKAPAVREVRRIVEKVTSPDDPMVVVESYVDKRPLGANGFNVPSLLGVSVGGGYFHAGNARTLEELFDVAFAAHHQAMGPFQPSAEDVRALVTYLLSLDEGDDTDVVPLASPAQGEVEFDPDLCGQFR